jgi:hypothetical protein
MAFEKNVQKCQSKCQQIHLKKRKWTVNDVVSIVDPQANVAPGIPEAAICVQDIAAQYILQFAIVIALCCALHRFASRVIHRSECFYSFYYQHFFSFDLNLI